jgi:class 3 adenylate cyclase/tetratricopeptide (TPR) repeat protein
MARRTLVPMVTCAFCGRENPPDARFCNGCAAPLAAVEEPVREERKVVTVLFVDLVGSTSAAEQLDPEDVRARLAPYWRHVRSELEQHGATVEKFIGDAVVALFGAPAAHEDDPERAVRAGLAIRDWAREQSQLQVRIAVATGEALVRLGARPLEGEGMASGDVLNTASRLQNVAPANGLLVDEGTYRATKDAILCRELRAVDVKGKTEPVCVWEALEARSRLGVDLTRETKTPLVGRRRELAALADALDRARAECAAQLVTLVGVPGIGKSRLVYELMQVVRAEPDYTTWRQGRSLPYGEGVSMWAFAEMVKAQAGILETDSPESAEEKLAASVASVVEEEESEWIARHLRPLVGLSADASDAARNEAFASWRRYIEAIAGQGPLVLVFEDVHWGDDNLLDFIDHLIDWATSVPLLVVCTARPELLDRRPSWGGGKRNSTTLSLAALSDKETSQLVAALLERKLLAGDPQPELLARAGGNPLYAEQFVRMLEERDSGDLPETVQGVIAARLDGLSAAEKAVLQDAAVLAKVFWVGAVVAIGGRDRAQLAELLHGLERKEFVRRAVRSSVGDDAEYSFAHVLVRDVAYKQIPRVARVEKHRAAAEWIESLGRPDDLAEMLAHHHSTSLELARASGTADAALEAAAGAALVRAGDRALSLDAYASAAAFYERALELSPSDDPARAQLLFRHAQALFRGGDDRRERALEDARAALVQAGETDAAAEADALLAEVWWLRGQRERCYDHLERALDAVRGAAPSPAKGRVLAQFARYRMVAADYAAAIAHGREALALARMFELPEVIAHALNTVGSARGLGGDEAGVRQIEEAIEFALATNQYAAASRAYNNLATLTDEATKSLELFRRAEELLYRIGDFEGARYPRALRINNEFWLGRWNDALPEADEFIAECEAGRPHYQETSLRESRAFARVARGDTEGAIADAERALAIARAAADPQALNPALSSAAWVYAELGLLDKSRAAAAEMLAKPEGAFFGGGPVAVVVRRIRLFDEFSAALTKVTARRFRHHERRVRQLQRIAAGRYADAADADEALEGQLVTFSAYLRLLAAEEFAARGKRAEADAQLQQALPFFRSVSASSWIERAESLLAAPTT